MTCIYSEYAVFSGEPKTQIIENNMDTLQVKDYWLYAKDDGDGGTKDPPVDPPVDPPPGGG